jgi:peptide deformylase
MMAALALCCEPHPALRARAKPVERVTQEMRQLVRDMIDTMYEHDGIGLAAPQVGQDLQLFVANPSQERGRELVIMNPSLEAIRGRTKVMEGCLSLPNVWARVARSATVRLRGLDLAGKPLTMDAQGLLAVVFQHEFDHLQGRLFIDRLPWWRRAQLRLKRQLPPARRAGARR